MSEVQKTVTIVFSDLAGSTAGKGEQLDPESLRSLMTHHHEVPRSLSAVLARAVERNPEAGNVETRTPYRNWIRGLAVPAIAVALAACSEAPSTAGRSTTPGIDPTDAVTAAGSSVSPAPTPRTFESTRHGYSVEVPPGWNVTEYEGAWTSLEQFSPGAEVPGEDVVTAPEIASFLVANSMAIPEEMTAADWLAAFDALVAGGLDPNCPGKTGRGFVAGEPATIVEQPCEGSIIIGRSLTHGGRGYYFTTRFSAGDATTEATVKGIVASIRFIDD